MDASRGGRKKYSEVWNYFKEIDYFKAMCRYCKHKLSYRTSTSNLMKHLKRCRPTLQFAAPKKTVEMVNMDNFDVNEMREGSVSPVADLGSIGIPASSSEDEDSTKDKIKRSHIKRELEPMSPKAPTKRKKFKFQKQLLDESDQWNLDEEANACNAFTTSLAFQLHRMEKNQRYIAEKLIGDIVYNGRFGKLSEDSQLIAPQKMSMRNFLPDTGDGVKQQPVCLKYNGETVYIQNGQELEPITNVTTT